jgi:hypothetical protein
VAPVASEKIRDRCRIQTTTWTAHGQIGNGAKSARGRVAIAVLAALAVVVVLLVATGSGGHKPPSCQAHTAECRETADGLWVPFWYYGGLSLAQGGTGRAPSTTGTQPTASQLQRAGATPEEADQAESYAESDDSGDDSGSDHSGDDDGGD